MRTGCNISVNEETLRPEWVSGLKYETKDEDSYCLDAPSYISAGSCRSIGLNEYMNNTHNVHIPVWVKRG